MSKNDQTHLVDILSQAIGHVDSSHEQPVVLVGRLAQTHLVGLLGNSLSVGHDRVGLLDGNLGVILLQILEANLQMKLTGTSDDVLARLFDDALNHGVRFGQTLQSWEEK